MKIQILVVVLCHLSALLQSVQSCTPEQPILSIGDHDCEATISFVSKTSCSGFSPTANIKDILTEEILRVSPIMSDDYNGQFPTGGKTSTTFATYTSSAYFYRANLTCDRYYTWTIEGFTNIGSHSFVLRNLTAQKLSRYFSINDYDLTIPGQTSTLAAMKRIDFTQYDGFIQAGDIAYDVQYYAGKQGEDTTTPSSLPLRGRRT